MMTLILFTLKSTVILGAALLMCLRSRWSAAQRHLILGLGIFCLPVLLAVQLTPGISLPAQTEIATWVPSIAIGQIEIDVAQTVTASTPYDFLHLLEMLYVTGAAALFAVWLFRVLSTPRWVGTTKSPKGRQSCVNGVAIRISNHLQSPMTWGVFKPEIVVPATWAQWSEQKQHAALTHELAHIYRRDTLMSMLSALMCCFFWFHPLVWIAQRKFMLAAEQACDDAVLSRGLSPITYAEQLLQIARQRRVGSALAMASPSTLPTRIKAILNTTNTRTVVSRNQFFRTATYLLVFVAPFGAIDATPEKPRLSSDGDIEPVVKVAVVYPHKAAKDGVEGFVTVSFAVNQNGETADAQVLEANPPGVFESAALAAISRYKYKPRIVDGQPVAVLGVTARLDFKLNGGGATDIAPVQKTPAMSKAIYSGLTQAKSAIDASEFESAQTILDTLKAGSGQMNGNELAQVHSMAGFLAYSTGDFVSAVAEYEKVIAQGNAPPQGLRTTTLYTLAQLAFVNRDFNQSLQRIRQWMELAETPGPHTPHLYGPGLL